MTPCYQARGPPQQLYCRTGYSLVVYPGGIIQGTEEEYNLFGKQTLIQSIRRGRGWGVKYPAPSVTPYYPALEDHDSNFIVGQVTL